METSQDLTKEAQEQIARDRAALMSQAVKEVAEMWNEKIAKSDARAAMDRQLHRDHMEAKHRADADKVDKTLDRIVGKKQRGRPKGSKNKPKPELVKPAQIGHIPDDDLIIRRS